MMKKLLATAAALGFVGNAMAADLSEMTWDEIMAQAKEEGEVNWYVWYFEDRFRVFVEQFTEETGIKVTIPEGDHVPNIDKTIADGSRETGDVDVLAIGYDRLPDVPQDLFTSLTMLPPDEPKKEIVAWAVQREDGGRGAGLVIPHFFRSWRIEDLRRLVLNSICWSAKLDIPAGGVVAPLPDLAQFKPEAVEPQPRSK